MVDVEEGEICAQHVHLCILSVGVILDAVVVTGVIVISQLGSTGFVEVLGHALIFFLSFMSWFPRPSCLPSGF